MTPWLDVRRLVALDMAAHGTRFIVAEFAVGVIGCAILGWLALAAGIHALPREVSWQLIVGIVLVGAAFNYVPLFLHSIDIARRHSAREEAAEELQRPDLMRRYGVRQSLLLVPFAVLVIASVQARARG